MDYWILLITTLLAAIASVVGMICVHYGHRSKLTILWMIAVFIGQLAFLGMRGHLHHACPLNNHSEILVFLSWAITLFYLLIGTSYRVSLLGVFSAPLVVLFQTIAMVPGIFETFPPLDQHPSNIWHEIHSATAVLSYGAFGLAAVASVMFLVLDKQLKLHHLTSGLFRNLPPARTLLTSTQRLLILATAILTLGIIAAFFQPKQPSIFGHFLAAILTWLSYASLIAIQTFRGLTGKRLAVCVIVIFCSSLAVFAFLFI